MDNEKKNNHEEKVHIVKPSLKLLEVTFPETTDRNKLQMTNTGLYSVTKKKGALFIVDRILYHMNNDKNITITDGTANNGSDTIVLAQTFNKVNAIEIDKVNFDVLSNNVFVFNLKNVTLINADTIIAINDLKQDVIYIDAPWGGKNYKDQSVMKLFLGDLEISYFYLKYKYKAKLFVFKVPKNYDFNYFINITKMNTITIYPFIDYHEYNTLRFYLIIINTLL